MLIRVDDRWVQGTYLNFKDEGTVSTGSITHRYTVSSRLNGSVLGHIRWFNQWRKYCLFPVEAVFEEVCLREIAEYIEDLTKTQRQGWKK